MFSVCLGFLLHRLPQHRMGFFPAPGVAPLLNGSVLVWGQGRDLLDVQGNPMLGFVVPSYGVRIACCVVAKLAGVQQIRVETVLVSAQTAPGFSSEITETTKVESAKVVEDELMFDLEMVDDDFALGRFELTMGAVVAGKFVHSHLVPVEESILLSFEAAICKVTGKVLVLLQVDALDVLLQGTPILGLIFTLVARVSHHLMFCKVVLFEVGSVAALVIALVALIKDSLMGTVVVIGQGSWTF